MSRLSTLCALLVCLALVAFYTSTQPRIEYRDGHPYDSETYWHQARLVSHDQPLRNWKPFVYRMGAPYVVGKWYPPLARSANKVMGPVDTRTGPEPRFDPDDPLIGFTWLGFGCGLVQLLLLGWLLRLYGLRTPLALGLLVLFIANPLGPFRFSPFFPAFADPLAFVFFLALFVGYRRDRELSSWTTLALCALGFVGAFVREIVLLVPLTFLGAHGIRVLRGQAKAFGRTTWMHLLPIACIGLGLYMTRHLVVEAMGEYSTWAHAQQIWHRNAQFPEIFALCLFMVLGTFVVWLLLGLREKAARGFLAQNPELILYIPGMAALAVTAGNHTDRFAFWILPGLLPVLGFYLQNKVAWPKFPATRMLFFGLLFVSQILAYRIWLPIPPATFDTLNFPGMPEHLWLAPFGENTNFGQTQIAFMQQWARVVLAIQYSLLAVLLVGIWWCDRRFTQGPHLVDPVALKPVTTA